MQRAVFGLASCVVVGALLGSCYLATEPQSLAQAAAETETKSAKKLTAKKPAAAKGEAAKGDAAKDDAAATTKKSAKPAAEESAKQQFMRIVRDAKQTPVSLDTAIVRYVAEGGKYDGAVVDLIGAVHIGDQRYYRKLNKQFTEYDALLYELLAPKGHRVPKGGGGGSGHPIGLMQEGMTEALGLAYQLEEIDYTKKNFVHADMTPDEFSAKMKEKGESWTGMMFRAMGQGLAMQAQGKGPVGTEVEMLFALFDKNRELKLKRALAKQFEDMDDMMGAFEGEDGSTIITERNKAAFKVLAEQLAEGKKKIGVFYGAGHLDDMDKRLLEEFGLKRESTQWLTAWDMTDAAAKPKKKK
ncbi:MAG: hypothetical protein J0M17_19580 [Planctomycetes bacterium]|nr:hypothetical protein [Planctomycetota bacterium]